MEFLNELARIKEVMGIQEAEGSGKQMNINLKKVVYTLTLLKLYTKKLEKMLMDLSYLAEDRIIDFDMVERGLRKILLKKGDKKKNVQDYFTNIINSLRYRERSDYGVEPDREDYEFEPEEPSIIPKKVYKKEVYYLQVELLKLQEWLKKTGKTIIVVFEGRDSAGKGSTIKKFTENLNPRYYNVVALGVPTPEDRKDWWNRYKREIKKGMINLFDRSWYNRGLVEPFPAESLPSKTTITVFPVFFNHSCNFSNSTCNS